MVPGSQPESANHHRSEHGVDFKRYSRGEASKCPGVLTEFEGGFALEASLDPPINVEPAHIFAMALLAVAYV